MEFFREFFEHGWFVRCIKTMFVVLIQKKRGGGGGGRRMGGI